MEWKRVTMKSIASVAGVDVSTVSRALSGSPRVRQETGDSIRRLAEELYVRSAGAASDKTVGVLLPEVDNAFYTEILSALEERLAEAGYSVLLGLTHYQPSTRRQCLDLLLSQSVDGVIFFSTVLPGHPKLRAGLPAVLVDFQDSSAPVDTITADNSYGIKLAVDYLVSLGHQTIAFLADQVTVPERVQTFEQETKIQGFRCPEAIIRTDARFEAGGMEGIEQLLRRGIVPTAVLCANDAMALGAIKALNAQRLSVPRDVSVMGYDDSAHLDYLPQSITTVRQPKQLLGEQAANLLMRRIREPEGPPEKIVVRPELVIRKSTAAYRGTAR